MKLGAFSISLTVENLEASKSFYEKLGFRVRGGNAAQDWLVMENEDNHVIGLFHGKFPKNMLTFSPGWDQDRQELGSFTDVRDLQRELKMQGITFATEADETTTGPASFMIFDPDGNPILVDQYV